MRYLFIYLFIFPLYVLFVSFGTGHFVTMSADESETGLQSSPTRRRRDANVTSTGAVSLATCAVSSALKIDLPPAFKGDGTESFTSWSRRFEVAVQAMSSTDTDLYTVMASVLPTRLADAAFLYWDSLPSSIQKDYDSVKEKLRDVFGPIYSLPFFQTHVNARPRRPGESLDVYSADITRLVLEAFPNYDHNALEGEKFRRFVAGLDPNLQSKVHEMGAEDLEDALRIASRCERARAALQLTTVGSPHSQSSEQVAMVRPKSTDDKLLHAVEQLTLTVNSLQSEVHLLREKHSYLAQRLDSQTERFSSDDARYSARSVSPQPYYNRQHRRDNYSPEQYHGRDTGSCYDHCPPSPVTQRDHQWHDNDRRDRHRSPSRQSYQYSRYGRHDKDDTNRYRRSPSPAPQGNRDASPHARGSVRFKSPERYPHSDSNRQGNFH